MEKRREKVMVEANGMKKSQLELSSRGELHILKAVRS